MSRYEKYRNLREGIKEINDDKKNNENIMEATPESQEDDFLNFLGEAKKAPAPTPVAHDTLEVAKTFQEIKNEKTPEVDRALKSAKKSLGEDEDTRMNILNRIKNPQTETVTVDSDDLYQTEDFKAGMFIHPTQGAIKANGAGDKVAKDTSAPAAPKRQKTLMERLEEISKEQEESNRETAVEAEPEKTVEMPVFAQEMAPIQEIEAGDFDHNEEFDENGKGSLILNVIIGILLVVFVALCIYIAIQYIGG